MSTAFQLDVNSDGIGKLIFDLPNEKVNKFSISVLEELEKIVDSLAVRSDIKALLVVSGKPAIFIAGADLRSFGPAFKDPALMEKIIRLGHRVFDKWQQLPFPTIAVIHGACVGGGLEFSLACTYRIATDHPKTVLGLPEVTLGIIPGWGGTQRLPRLVGLMQGMNMILTGKPVNAKKAWKMHLADALIPWEFQEERIAEFTAAILKNSGSHQVIERRKQPLVKSWLMEKNFLGRGLLFFKAKKEVLQKTKGHYPAPLAALTLLKETCNLPLHKGLEREISAFLTLAKESASQAENLIDLFFIQESLKKGADVAPLQVKSTAVLGAGTMGSGIAWLLADHRFPVRLKDLDWAQLGKGFGTVYSLFAKGVKNKKIKPSEADLKFQLLSGTVDYSGFANCDLVIEAAVENPNLKKEIFQQLENVIRPDAIIASNTSSLTIKEMSVSLRYPERFIGMHFFNPVNKMPLVEVVPGTKTSPKTIATALDVCKKTGKTPIIVGDCPGFLVNRIFMAGANEVMWLFQEGVPMEKVEKLFADFGMPMSPFKLTDEVGNDVTYKVAKTLEAAYGERMHCPDILQSMYDHHLVGKKCGKGFYLYQGEAAKPNPEVKDILSRFNPTHQKITDEDILDRILLMMVNEAARCLEEKIINSAAYLDMAMILGTGFPPFRGGLLKYADTLGIEFIVNRLNHFTNIYSPRFTPALSLLTMYDAGNRFYE